MANKLLSASQILKAKNALEDVTFTFHTSDVVYGSITQGLPNFGEENNTVETKYPLKAFLEYNESSGDEIKSTQTGTTDYFDVKLTFNLRDIETAGCDDSFGKSIFKADNDFVYVDNEKFKVKKVSYDGFLDRIPVLCIVLAEKT